MKVRELIEALSEFDGELEIIAGTDDEGNDYDFAYPPRVTWAVKDDYFRCGIHPIHDDDKETEYDDYDVFRVVVF